MVEPWKHMATPGPRQSGCWEVADAECDLMFLCPPEAVAIWDVVATYVREQLLVHKVCWLSGSSPCPAQPTVPLRLPLHAQEETHPTFPCCASHGLPANAGMHVVGRVAAQG